MNSIDKQRKFLSENLIVESLRMYDLNQEDVKSFIQPSHGHIIADYLVTDSWEEDTNNNTRVFLVRDKKTRKIAYYYALNCGILYKDLNAMHMTHNEEECVERLKRAYIQANQPNLNRADQETANKSLEEAYALFDERITDTDRTTNLINYAIEQAESREENEHDKKEDCVRDVLETYPAIDIKFLCRNADYHPAIAIDFKFGVFVFWEIIVPHVLKIADLIGCKYLYLFAADDTNTESTDTQTNATVLYSQEYDLDIQYEEIEEVTSEQDEVKKLVEYYKNDLKFRLVSEYSTDYIILKPHFERNCYTLIQDVANLAYNRELVWSSHDEDHAAGTLSDAEE